MARFPLKRRTRLRFSPKQKLHTSCLYFYLVLCHQILGTTLAAVLKKTAHRRIKRGLAAKYRLKQISKIIALQQTRGKIKTRSRDWWEQVICRERLSESEWLENFRMTQNTFQIICSDLRGTLKPKPDGLDIFWKQKRKLTVEKKVAIALYFLASCCEYRIVANQFGVQKSTVCKVVHEFVSATNKVLAPKYIRFPNSAEAQEISDKFKHRSKIPNIIGAIDGTHIPILPPSDGYRDYINRKGWASLVLQSVVDSSFKFTDISIKLPGRCHDMAVFMASNLYKRIHDVMPESPVHINERQLPWVLIGDPAYPLLPWLLKGFSGPNLTEMEDSFNVYLNSARVAVEIAFGRLKARWRCLLKRLDAHHSFVPDLVATCCTLHNIVETYKDDFIPSWVEAVKEAELLFEQPSQHIPNTRDEHAGYDLRVFLTQYLAENYPLRSSQHH